jgi:hypothetical protein
MFVSLDGGMTTKCPLGKTAEICIAGKRLLLDSQEAARHQNGMWERDGHNYTNVMIEGTARIAFTRTDGVARAATDCGHVAFHNGALWVKGPIDALLATLDDETGVWTLRLDGTQWDGVTVTACEP